MHKNLHSNVIIETSNPVNRFIKSKSEISKYTKIINVSPLLSVVSDYMRSKICESCYQIVNKLIPCPGCKTVYFCSKKCHEKNWKSIHSIECIKLQKIKESIQKRDLKNFIKEDYKKVELQIQKNDFKLFDQFFLSMKIFIKCFLQKKVEFQKCLNQLYFTIININEQERARLFLYTTYIVHMFQEKIVLEKKVIENYLNQCKQNLVFDLDKIKEYFFKLENYIVTNISKKKKGYLYFYNHDFDILSNSNSTMQMIFGKIFFNF